MLNSTARRMMIWSLCCLFAPLIIGLHETPAETGDLFSFTIVLAEKGCQMAIWLADEQGNFIDTVFVTSKTALKGIGNRGGELDDRWGGSRLSVLPVWAHHRGVDYGGGNYYPPKDKPLVDAVSSATPKAGEFVWNWRPQQALKPGKYAYYVEINKSSDDNQYHNHSWYRGQPSVVWKGDLLIGDQVSKSKALVIGHGHVAGADGKILSDLSTLTTAFDLIRSVEVSYTPGQK